MSDMSASEVVAFVAFVLVWCVLLSLPTAKAAWRARRRRRNLKARRAWAKVYRDLYRNCPPPPKRKDYAG